MKPSLDLPPALPSMWRLCKLGYRHEPGLMLSAFGLVLLAALPDALIALWLKLLGEGLLEHDGRRVRVAAIALGVSAAATWLLRTVSVRVQRRFRDKVTIALEAHVARLQASVATIAHHERPDYLDRLSVLRDQIFVLDHMYMSVFSTCGWILRLGVTLALLISIHPALALLAVFAIPTVLTSSWRPAVERAAQESGAQSARLARHLFNLATTAPPGKEVRVTGIGGRLAKERREAFERWYGPIAAARWGSAVWHTLAWALFGAAWVGAAAFVSLGIRASAGDVLLVLAAGARLSAYIGATVGEIGFLRGIWMDGSQRLAWLEDYAASLVADADLPVPARLREGIRLDRVSFAYPGTERLVLEDVTLELPAGAVVAIVGENGAGKTTLVKLLAKLYEPTSGEIRVDGQPLARMRADAWRERLAGAFQDFFRFELPGAPVGRRRRRAAARRRARRRPRGRAGRGGGRGGALARRARHPARPHLARRRRRLLRPVAEAGPGARLHARPPAPARARRAHGRPRRRDRARPLRALRRRHPRRRLRGRPHHPPRLPPLQHRPHGRPHRRPRRRAPRRGRHPRGAAGAGRAVLRAVWDSGGGVPVRCVKSPRPRRDRGCVARSGLPVPVGYTTQESGVGGQAMSHILTAAQIGQQFESEWVLVEDPKTNDTLEVESGQVLWHSKDRDEVYRKAVELRPKRFAMLYTGKMPEDTAVVL